MSGATFDSTARPFAPPLPRFAQIEPIGRCNLACRMCTVNERGDEVAELPLARFAELLDQMPQLQELHLQGLGEPMLHPQFFEMVEMAVARGIHVSANSNLTLLTPARAQRCATSGLSALSVSLDGASAPVYESIRRKASFAKVLRNLGRLVDARDATGSALKVRLVMVLMRANLHELPALVGLAHAHRVREILVQRLSSDLTQPDLPARYIPIKQYVDDAELHDNDLPLAHGVFEQARALANHHGITLHLPKLEAVEPAGDRQCDWPWTQLYITAAGELLPCCMVATADRVRWGNAFAPQPLQGSPEGGLLAAWQGDAARSFREALAGATPPSVCRSCALYRGTF